MLDPAFDSFGLVEHRIVDSAEQRSIREDQEAWTKGEVDMPGDS